MRVISLPGTQIAGWHGVQVWRLDRDGYYSDVTDRWNFSTTPHHHYEVRRLATGSFYCPVSTNPPGSWQLPVAVVGTAPAGGHPVNPNGTEYRPTGTYFWIPNAAIPRTIVPGENSNAVVCNCPDEYPPSNAHLLQGPRAADVAALESKDQLAINRHDAFDQLAQIIGPETGPLLLAAGDADQKAFEDSDGLVSFVNLSSSFVTGNPQFLTGRNVCDKIASYFATIRQNVYAAQLKDPKFILPGDPKPKNQWDLPVTNKMQKLLVDAGGLSSFKITTETFTNTQVLAEFSTDFIKLIFDAAVVPSGVIESVAKFMQGVGNTLRSSWDQKERSFSTTLLGQCHEAVPIDSTGGTTVYVPKVKFFHIDVTSEQTAFTTSCSKVEKISFNFKYESYVAALKNSVLDPASKDYINFTAFLDRAQRINYADATNNLDAILADSVSGGGKTATERQGLLSDINELGIDLTAYPRLVLRVPRPIERHLQAPQEAPAK
ncbi:hypothetical protein [Jeongeupia naejangsanensis]|uniref:Virulence factor Evf domain-containing protein n=1 Tax=Jeongeupia naejangsanensis TaxID=613195 RepID=A0ABS2BL76_9NEIS|nr:hypothetical protein [Jeongeupia naejangsanensis]MBM3116210.1 hypothetical protein [Jeongeupia naejangsanensis]